ncbi:outer membrane lipoprotein chaperone LolA [uncultured Umboniibacter sp.]|uniref:outer membrane lipoprotein chaperone LolA n=1 Tax=uncultured Umboniibacter sp. TaxID=1798917 RepID=UPI0026130D47|nr:outer membrane lipoprotein chaperone LolA [uncultured Umboniibacter sp.]
MMLLRLLSVIILASFSSQAPAQEFSELSSLLAKHSAFSAQFEQSSYDENGQLMTTSSGSADLASGQRLRWETLSPWPQLLIVNDSSVWLYDPDLEQASYRTIDSSSPVNPALLFNADVEAIAEVFEITELAHGYKFTPLSTSQFSVIELVQDGDLIAGLNYVDLIGQRTEVVFFQHNFSVPEDQMFEFTPPEGVEVVTGG